ncbi:Cytochrome P450 71A25 [Acorus calamus]|uniref:Cytochrome P450 71A25 n=1 Tax=Acorus calamus TaxID=4465 RepID=A0AAV9F3J2_ACOCL|nr:Cytochrome P450 71A25 [Acorus calamus]
MEDSGILSNNLLFLILLISIPLFLLKRSLTKKPNLPPSPLKLPIIGHLHLIGPSPHQSLHDLSKKYGPLMYLQLGQVPTLVVSSPEYAQEILKTQDRVFASRPALKVPQLLLYGARDITFSPYGEFWRQVRKITTVHLLSSKRVKSYRVVREESVALMIQSIRNASGLVNLSDILYAFTTSIIARVTFGKEFLRPGVTKRIHGLVNENMKLMSGLHLEDCFPGHNWLDFFTGLSGRISKNFHGWDSLFEEAIEDHIRAEGTVVDKGERDFVDVLLGLQMDENTKDDVSLTREDMKAILEDMFAAGTDTIFILLEWAMAELIKNPNAMNKAKEEIIQIMKGKSAIDEDDIDHMMYLRAIIKEALRLHPPAPLSIPHESMEDTMIKNYKIPACTRIILNIWSIGRTLITGNPRTCFSQRDLLIIPWIIKEMTSNSSHLVEVEGSAQPYNLRSSMLSLRSQILFITLNGNGPVGWRTWTCLNPLASPHQ